LYRNFIKRTNEAEITIYTQAIVSNALVKNLLKKNDSHNSLLTSFCYNISFTYTLNKKIVFISTTP